MTNGNVTLGFDPQVGDQAQVIYYSDVHPCTVVKRTKKFAPSICLNLLRVIPVS